MVPCQCWGHHLEGGVLNNAIFTLDIVQATHGSHARPQRVLSRHAWPQPALSRHARLQRVLSPHARPQQVANNMTMALG
eukprot:CAMPEP_0202917590 /NCGR_PEP_ID=MMETSP1392-20130828/71342_1 /ASSEMBLY_ACC=CAM_ASM_000868 /TAXON_ID=225041 /ORGANISM="Chlamydomonas chlamydogama, Strain SAG 11-48b" /LENGTH=78 /DNA_ID=CAMNT_0049610379 /DNA_START=204 /DNA_END=437 /DNA_ORIENTATION=+